MFLESFRRTIRNSRTREHGRQWRGARCPPRPEPPSRGPCRDAVPRFRSETGSLTMRVLICPQGTRRSSRSCGRGRRASCCRETRPFTTRPRSRTATFPSPSSANSPSSGAPARLSPRGARRAPLRAGRPHASAPCHLPRLAPAGPRSSTRGAVRDTSSPAGSARVRRRVPRTTERQRRVSLRLPMHLALPGRRRAAAGMAPRTPALPRIAGCGCWRPWAPRG